MRDSKNIEMIKGALMWFSIDDLRASERYSDISSERTLSDDDDGFNYRPEQPRASYLT
jgi:hypothetical protein